MILRSNLRLSHGYTFFMISSGSSPEIWFLTSHHSIHPQSMCASSENSAILLWPLGRMLSLRLSCHTRAWQTGNGGSETISSKITIWIKWAARAECTVWSWRWWPQMNQGMLPSYWEKRRAWLAFWWRRNLKVKKITWSLENFTPHIHLHQPPNSFVLVNGNLLALPSSTS